MTVWKPKEGTANVQCIISEDGYGLGKWIVHTGMETPPNYSSNAFLGSGVFRKNKDLVTCFMCFNPEDLTVTFSSDSGPNRSWTSYNTISNKSIGLPPNMKSKTEVNE